MRYEQVFTLVAQHAPVLSIDTTAPAHPPGPHGARRSGNSQALEPELPPQRLRLIESLPGSLQVPSLTVHLG